MINSTTNDNADNAERKAEELKIAHYLKRNPDMLIRHSDVFIDMVVPHRTHGMTSLVKRQLEVLREKNQLLTQKLDELVTIARENEELNQRFHRFVLELMNNDELDDVLSIVQNQVQTFFHTDAVCFKFLPSISDTKNIFSAYYLDADTPIFKTALPWLENRKPICGQQPRDINAALFGTDMAIESSAIIPLYHTSSFGLLCLGSLDKDRFSQKMGTIFLKNLGELVSHRVQGFLSD